MLIKSPELTCGHSGYIIIDDELGEVKIEKVRESHLSIIYIGQKRVYKLLKPVDLGFLNHLTLQSRIASVKTEFDLGRHISPNVYTGIKSVNPAAPYKLNSNTEYGEPVLVMRKLDDALCLRFAKTGE